MNPDEHGWGRRNTAGTQIPKDPKEDGRRRCKAAVSLRYLGGYERLARIDLARTFCAASFVHRREAARSEIAPYLSIGWRFGLVLLPKHSAYGPHLYRDAFLSQSPRLLKSQVSNPKRRKSKTNPFRKVYKQISLNDLRKMTVPKWDNVSPLCCWFIQ
jgi:hypothetical protein